MIKNIADTIFLVTKQYFIVEEIMKFKYNELFQDLCTEIGEFHFGKKIVCDRAYFKHDLFII